MGKETSSTPIVTPVVTPVVTPIVTPIVTPVVTPVVTPIVTPVVTPVVTPQIVPAPQTGNDYEIDKKKTLVGGICLFIIGLGVYIVYCQALRAKYYDSICEVELEDNEPLKVVDSRKKGKNIIKLLKRKEKRNLDD